MPANDQPEIPPATRGQQRALASARRAEKALRREAMLGLVISGYEREAIAEKVGVSGMIDDQQRLIEARLSRARQRCDGQEIRSSRDRDRHGSARARGSGSKPRPGKLQSCRKRRLAL
jgi:hypothetical protein